jgi:DNA-binding PadR family transcriptional regulator
METKKPKKQRIYVATYNIRQDGVIKAVKVKATKKGNKYYALNDGTEIPFWAQIDLDNE